MGNEIQYVAPAMPELWLEQIENTAAEVGLHHIDLLLDQTSWATSAIPTVKRIQPEMPWFSLFSGTPEEPLIEHGPLLMRLDLQQWQHKGWLEDLIEHAGSDSRLLLLVTPQPFEDLSLALRALSRMQVGGQPGLLRYFDPRVFPLMLSDILDQEQCGAFLKVASFWSWLDRDGQPHWQLGTCTADPQPLDVPEPVALSDAQFEAFACISNAQKLIGKQLVAGEGLSKEQIFSQLYNWARAASAEGSFGDFESYVRNKLSTLRRE